LTDTDIMCINEHREVTTHILESIKQPHLGRRCICDCLL